MITPIKVFPVNTPRHGMQKTGVRDFLDDCAQRWTVSSVTRQVRTSLASLNVKQPLLSSWLEY